MVRADERKEWARDSLKGLFLGNTTPFDPETLALDEEALRWNLRHSVKLGANGIGAGGTLGEAFCMSTDERKRVHEILAEEAQQMGVISYAYPVSDSVPTTIELAEHAASVGCDILMVHVASEWAKSDESCYRYFETVAEHAGDLGVMLYDTPHAGGKLLSLELQSKIADLPNVCFCKGPGFKSVKETLEIVEAIGDRLVVPGTFEGWPDYAAAGFQLMQPSAVPYMLQTTEWRPVRDIYDLSVAGDLDAARAIYREIEPLRVTRRKVYETLFDRPMGEAEHPLALIKYWQDLIGRKGGPVRPLTAEADESSRQWLLAELQSHVVSGQIKLPGSHLVEAP